MTRPVLLAVMLCAGCAVHSGPSLREMQSMQEAQMQQALDLISATMEGQQDYLEGKDTEAARAYRQRSEAAEKQSRAMEEQLRRNPEYVLMQEESDREYREFLRKSPSGVESEFNLTDAEEIELGFGMAQQFLAGQRLVADEALQRYVNLVGMWVAQQSERPGLPWCFAVIEGDNANAFAVPGGYVFITRGMLELIETESELAAVLGHEISHVVRKHHLRWIYLSRDFETAVKRSEQSLGAMNPAAAAKFRELGRLMQRSFEQMNSPQMKAQLSKAEELQADTDGGVLAWRAGYEAWGLLAVLQRFEAAIRGRYPADALLAGHPEPLERFKLLALALNSQPESRTTGDTGEQRFREALARSRAR
jgi:predicted Zn-dependent protease